jgi:hypothetical protein
LYQSIDRYSTTRRLKDVITPMVTHVNRVHFMVDVHNFLDDPLLHPQMYRTDFFRNTVYPMAMSHRAYKNGNATLANEYACRVQSWDWCAACLMWLDNRPSMTKSLRRRTA